MKIKYTKNNGNESVIDCKVVTVGNVKYLKTTALHARLLKNDYPKDIEHDEVMYSPRTLAIKPLVKDMNYLDAISACEAIAKEAIAQNAHVICGDDSAGFDPEYVRVHFEIKRW